MSAHSKKTKQLLARVTELHAAGASAREIAEVCGVGHSTVSTWLRDVGLEPHGGSGARATRKRKAPGVVPPEVTQAAAEAIAADAAAEASLRGVESGAGVLRSRLAMVQATINAISTATIQGASSPALLSVLTNIEIKLAKALAETEPVKPLDPENDPTNIAEAEKVCAKLRVLVEDAEKRAALGRGGRK